MNAAPVTLSSATLLPPPSTRRKKFLKQPIERPRSAFMDSILGLAYDRLDHGFIRVVDYMGNNDSVVQAARVSYGEGTESVSSDEALTRYLHSHEHGTPFEMAGVKFHIRAPIFVARQWFRHRISSANEYSGRYSLLSNEAYIPDGLVLSRQSKDNKQGRESEPLPGPLADVVLDMLRQDATRCHATYQTLVDDKGDIRLARELARINLTLNCYTEWYWKINLRSLLNFLTLRTDGHAQYEIRTYADLIADILHGWCPAVWKAWQDYDVNAFKMSAQMLTALRHICASVEPHIAAGIAATSGMSKREAKAFLAAIGKAPNPA